MAALNRATLIGNVGRDPEIRHTQSGAVVANFSMATSEKWKDARGETKERTEWHSIVSFNEKQVNVIQQYVKKGSLICVEGRIQTRKWTDQNNIERYTTEIVLNNLVLLGRPAGASQEQQRAPAADGNFGSGARAAANPYDDEIPF
jgi:single-strand DNA-binding protein